MTTKKERQEAMFKDLFEKAHEAGTAAAFLTQPVPMVVEEHRSMLDDASPVVKQWYVPGGVCGFAWVSIKPANGPAAHYAVKNCGARPDSYYGGVSIWVSDFGQSMQIKEAYAQAYARVLADGGVKAYPMSRID